MGQPAPGAFIEPNWASLESIASGSAPTTTSRHSASEDIVRTFVASPVAISDATRSSHVAPSHEQTSHEQSSHEQSYYQVSMPEPRYPAALETPVLTTPPKPPKPSRRRWITVGILVGVVGAAGVAAVTMSGQNRIEEALQRCSLVANSGATVGDGGNSVTLDTEGEADASGLSFASLNCMISALDIPDSIDSRMMATRALDGVQSATYDEVSLSWSYHPDDGMTLIVSLD